jgi:ribose transport system ATP-binding protein
MQPAIRMTGIEKSFGSNRVLKGVDFEVLAGEVHALAGENGAGKSTLMKILQGVYPKDQGEIFLLGNKVEINDTFEARASGIGMVFQEFSLIPSLTVAQNVFLTQEPTNKVGLIQDRLAITRTNEIFEDMGVKVDAESRMEQNPTAIWQLTEIAKALAQQAQVLIMDEPTASLAKHEAEALFELIGRLKAKGIAIIYISHRMDEIYRIADRITVLRDGSRVLTASLRDVTPSEIVEAIIGRTGAAHLVHEDRRDRISNEILLEVTNLQDGQKIRGISFQLRRGEILGLAGLMGSGRTELVNALFGLSRSASGEIKIKGIQVGINSPKDAIAHSIALIPEDRRAQGLVLDHSVSENLVLPLLGQITTGPILISKKESDLSAKLIEKFSIKTSHPNMKISGLSGGNQQKVVIGKWLGTNPEILLMDEPTAGVDIGTKSEILSLVREIADQGKAVIFISSELPELLSVSDRILVIRDGQVTKDLSREDIHDEEYLQLAIQGV